MEPIILCEIKKIIHKWDIPTMNYIASAFSMQSKLAIDMLNQYMKTDPEMKRIVKSSQYEGNGESLVALLKQAINEELALRQDECDSNLQAAMMFKMFARRVETDLDKERASALFAFQTGKLQHATLDVITIVSTRWLSMSIDEQSAIARMLATTMQSGVASPSYGDEISSIVSTIIKKCRS